MDFGIDRKESQKGAKIRQGSGSSYSEALPPKLPKDLSAIGQKSADHAPDIVDGTAVVIAVQDRTDKAA